MRTRIIILGLTAVLLSGCSMAPDYARPTLPVENAWPQGNAAGQQAATDTGAFTADMDWRQFLRDPAMCRLVETGLENNRDLRVAVLNIEKARAQYRIQRADRLPTVNADAGSTQQRTPASLSGTGSGVTSHSYAVGLGVSSFELDLFGRVKSLSDEALETFLATTEARRGTYISLVAEISSDYLGLVADRERLKLDRETMDSHGRTLALTRRLYEEGQATELDVRQAEASLATARAQEAASRTQVGQDENALRLALGAALPADLQTPDTLGDVVEPEDVRAGLPSELLARRPDILQAEHQLKAANADIGAARANFFPKISLTGSLGTSSDELSGLFETASRTWTFAPQLVLPLFDFGRNQATLDASKASRDIAVAQYEKSVQTAFREVSDALAVRATIQERIAALEDSVRASRRSLELSQKRFADGTDSFLPVLVAQRTLYNAQTALLTLRLSRLNNLLTFYKALGGGWDAAAGS